MKQHENKIQRGSALNSAWFRVIQLKIFIKNWDFPSPDWSTLPKGFPNLDKKGLTKEEGHLLDGIKLAWLATGTGKAVLYKNTVRLGVATVSVLFIIIFGVSAVKNLEGNHTKSVNAATISATFKKIQQGNGMEVIESTMSAVRRTSETSPSTATGSERGLGIFFSRLRRQVSKSLLHSSPCAATGSERGTGNSEAYLKP